MKRNRINAFIYFVYFYIFILTLSESRITDYKIIETVLFFTRFVLLIAFAAFAMKRMKFSKKLFFTVCLLFTVIIINMVFFSGGNSLLFTIVIVLAFFQSGISSKDMMRCVAKSSLLSELFVIVLSLMKVLPFEKYYRELSSFTGSFFAGGHYIYPLGFVNHNQISTCFFDILVLVICIRKNRLKKNYIIILLALAYGVYYLSNARVALIISSALLLSVLVYDMFGKNKVTKEKKHNLIWLTVPFLMVFNIVVVYIFNPYNWSMVVLDEIFSHRIRWSQQMMQHYGSSAFSLFGHGIEAGTTYENLGFIVDSGYIKEILQRGILISVMLVVIWAKALYDAEKNRDFYVAACIIAIAISNLVNDQFPSYRLVPLYCLMIEPYIGKIRRWRNSSYGFANNSRL